MEKSTKKKIWIATGIISGIAAGAGAVYYKMRKETMNPKIPLAPDLNATVPTEKKKNQNGIIKYVSDECFEDSEKESDKGLVKKRIYDRKK